MELNNKEYTERLVKSLLEKDSIALELLSVAHTNTLSDEIRDIIASLNDDDQQKISSFLNEMLINLYEGTYSPDINEQKLFIIKENLIYYVGRLGNKDSVEIINKYHYKETNEFNKMNLAFSACFLGDQEVELDFLSKVTPGSSYDLMMRSWTLAFFKDASNPHEYIDDKNDDWTAAKLPRIKRLQINEPGQKGYKKAMAFRLFDLTILYLFCKNRSFDDLTVSEYEIIKNSTSVSPLIAKGKMDKIEAIKARLLNKD